MKTPVGTSGQVTDIFDEEFDADISGKSDFAAMAKKITISEVSLVPKILLPCPSR